MEESSVSDTLITFGLSDKEAKIYLTCLELGSATANKISEKSYLNRSTTYDVLKSLLEKGLASKIIKNSTTYFEVATPEKLISILDEKRAKINSVMDKLKVMQEYTVQKPVVEVYEGMEGFKTILDDILSEKKHTDVISTSKIFEIMKNFFPYYIQRRFELKISARVIQEYSKQTIELRKSDTKALRKTKSIKDFHINSMIFIYGNKIATIKLVEREIISILISDNSLADDQRKIFDMLWSIAK